MENGTTSTQIRTSVDIRLEELRRRWENATDEREKTQVSEQSASGNHIGPNDPHHKALDNSLVQKLGSSKI